MNHMFKWSRRSKMRKDFISRMISIWQKICKKLSRKFSQLAKVLIWILMSNQWTWRTHIQTAATTFLNMHSTTSYWESSKVLNTHHSEFHAFLASCILVSLSSNQVLKLISFWFQGKTLEEWVEDLLLEVLIDKETLPIS